MSRVVKQVCLHCVVAFFLPATLFVASSAAQTVKSDIQKMTGWQSCSSCAGAGGTGPVASFSMTQFQTSPSMSGASSQQHIKPSKPYSNALWWKQLGANNGASHFVYDIYFYLRTPSYAQALEFDVNQSNGSHKFIFGTQCNIHGGGVFDVYDPAGHAWRHTGIACHAPSAYKWHHLTWELYRNSTSVHYVSVTLDGVKHYVNRSYLARSSSTKEINVAFQMDGDKYMHTYDTWIDRISLKYW
jgi:hypothetical protein